jgi:hypothetical protein
MGRTVHGQGRMAERHQRKTSPRARENGALSINRIREAIEREIYNQNLISFSFERTTASDMRLQLLPLFVTTLHFGFD